MTDAIIDAMQLEDAPTSFEEAVHSRGSALDDLDAVGLLVSMTEWYRTVRCSDAAPISSDGDMLLAQWGRWRHLTSDRNGSDQPPFGFDLTRQLIGPGEEDEDIWQLSVTLVYEPSPKTEAAGRSSRWCTDPSQVDEFVAWITESSAFRAIRDHEPTRFSVSWDIAG